VKSVATDEFCDRLGRLPGPVRQQASRASALWRAAPHHPGLQFKRVSQRQPVYSARSSIEGRRSFTSNCFSTQASGAKEWPDRNGLEPAKSDLQSVLMKLGGGAEP